MDAGLTEDTEDRIMEVTPPTEVTVAATEDMARDLLSLSPVMATLVTAILAMGVMEDTEDMEPLTDPIVDTDTIRRALAALKIFIL